MTTATARQRSEAGRAARAVVPRSGMGDWEPSADRTDPLSILALQAMTRVPELIPIRHGRMAASPFAFYRGAAAVMAADLAGQPRTNLMVQLCGDAHLVNFGGFGSPERDLVFDLNDFDETHPGPFEWDVKRLAASLEVAARGRGMDEAARAKVVRGAVRSYRESINEFAGMGSLSQWYVHLDVEGIVARWGAEAGDQAVRNTLKLAAKGTSKDHLKAATKLVEPGGQGLVFKSDPPLLAPVEEFEGGEADAIQHTVAEGLAAYRRTLSGERRTLLDRYQYVHLARKVVGVGSVGTRCWVALLVGRDESDPLLMQVKQAEESVLAPFLGRSKFNNQGQRVVEGQRVMQATSDILLGWARVTGIDGEPRDFYFRQLWDWKTSPDVDTMLPETFGVYGQICGWTMARAHARSGDAIGIAAYLGRSDRFDQSMARFATVYADQNDLDHQRLVDAIAAGTVEAVSGV